MSKRIIQSDRVKMAKNEIEILGYEITFENTSRIEFEFKSGKVVFFPYTGWHTGKTIRDGRGLKKLISQIK